MTSRVLLPSQLLAYDTWTPQVGHASESPGSNVPGISTLISESVGAPERIRTPNLLIRRKPGFRPGRVESRSGVVTSEVTFTHYPWRHPVSMRRMHLS